jgi:hypothetical protein
MGFESQEHQALKCTNQALNILDTAVLSFYDAPLPAFSSDFK